MENSLESVSLQLQSKLSGWMRSVLSGPHWRTKALLAVVAISLLRAFPSYEALHTDFVKATWRNAESKFDNPMTDSGAMFPSESHESKLAFRLTVPVLAHVFHLRRTGALILFAGAGVLLLHTVLGVAYTITTSKTAAFSVCLATACAWPGEAGFHELRGGYYDAMALCLLLLSLPVTSPLLTAILVFLAAWTDERSLLASSFLFLIGKPAATLAACAGYVGVRTYLTLTHSFAATTTAGIGFAVLCRQANIIPLGIWTGLSGNWIIVVCGLIALLLRKRYLMAVGYVLALVMTVGVALSVVDVTRSMSYCLPAVFVGLAFLNNEPIRTVEKIAILSGLVSLVVPTHYVEGNAGLWWLYPLPVQIVQWLSQVVWSRQA
jgi:hypothetical protein